VTTTQEVPTAIGLPTDAPVAPPTVRGRDVLLRLRRNPGALIGAAIVGIVVVLAVFAPLIAPETPSGQAYLDRLGGSCCPGPSAEYWFGLDDLGRDVFSRIVYGARVSLIVAVASVSLAFVVGGLLGAVAGYFGGPTDSAIMRVADVMLAFPSFLFAIGLVALLGPGLWQLIVAIGIANVPIFARLLRGSMLGVRTSPYISSARVLGLPSRRVLAVHMLPNAVSPLIVAATLALATAIIETAGLGFLGLGTNDPAQPEWGAMLANTSRYLQTAPHLAFFPGAAIVITVLGFNLFGDGLREAIDPRLI
jgi:peptide/nickel transport system permease protein